MLPDVAMHEFDGRSSTHSKIQSTSGRIPVLFHISNHKEMLIVSFCSFNWFNHLYKAVRTSGVKTRMIGVMHQVLYESVWAAILKTYKAGIRGKFRSNCIHS